MRRPCPAAQTVVSCKVSDVTSKRRVPAALIGELEAIVVGAVAVTATAVAEAAPELTLLQWRTLVILVDEPAGLPVSELARRLGSRLPATSRLLSRLRTRGLLELRKDQADARITTVVVTDAGRDVWRDVAERRRAALRLIARDGDLEPADSTAIVKLAAAFRARR
jgi:DNA-binding MarR family transcriptional regulator